MRKHKNDTNFRKQIESNSKETKKQRKAVFKGEETNTKGLITKCDLTLSKKKKVVSKAKSDAGKKNPWIKAAQEALVIIRKKYPKEKGMIMMSKSGKIGTPGRDLYDMAKEIHKKAKKK